MHSNINKSWDVAAGLGRGVFAFAFIAAGITHFVMPGFYLKIMPPYIPFHQFCVAFSGLIEVLLGILLLIPRTRKLAGWGLIALLIAVFPANIYVYQHQDEFPLPAFVHLLRLPLQGVLIAWAYVYARGTSPRTLG